MTEKKVIHQIKLDRSIKTLLWGFVIAIALNAMPKGFLIEDAMAQLRSGSEYQPIYIEHRGRINNPIYKADEVEQLHHQLWQYKYTKPHDNWHKGKDRGYSFKGVRLNKF